MDYHFFGKTLGMLRRQQGISQRKLCEGIMTKDNLSKLERGISGVSKEKLDKLLNRLGFVAKRFFPYPLAKSDLKVFKIKHEVKNLSALNDHEGVAVQIEKMESMEEFKEPLNNQFLLKFKAIHCMDISDEITIAKALLEQALRITMPLYNSALVHTYLLSDDEMQIICILAQIEFSDGNKDEAVELLRKLEISINQHYVDEYEKTRSLAFIRYSLSKYLGLMERYKEAIAVCEKAVEECVQNQAYGHLPMILFNQAYCIHHISNERKNEIKDLLFQSYYCSKAHGVAHYTEQIKRHALNMFGVDVGI